MSADERERLKMLVNGLAIIGVLYLKNNGARLSLPADFLECKDSNSFLASATFRG